ncbi:MAG: hypothetical protein IE921_09985 [Rhodobacteraceae bacterium]|nr:hypothetical protein [Paracoccaceae bacterium]
MVASVSEWILTVAGVGGGFSAVTYFALKKLAESWLDEKFKSRLQDLVHAQNKEIERLRSDLTTSFDRATKLHQREFEVLPQVWDEVHEAFWSTAALVSSFQSYPDLNCMKEQQLLEFLEKCELESWQKDELRTSSDPNKEYQQYSFWLQLSRANRARHSALNKVSRHAIFLDATVKEELLRILSRLNGALIEHESNNFGPRVRHSERLTTDIDWVKQQGSADLEAIEITIRQRLWSKATSIDLRGGQ